MKLFTMKQSRIQVMVSVIYINKQINSFTFKEYYLFQLLLLIIFNTILDTLPSLPVTSDNEQKKHAADEINQEVIVITDTDTDDENPPKRYV